MYADKLHMNLGHENSHRPQDIESLHIVGSGWDGYYPVEYVCNFLLRQPESIQLDFYPFEDLQPAIEPYGRRYVVSSPDPQVGDMLLYLAKS